MLVTLVHADACHFCEDADAALARLAEDFPLRVERVEAQSAAGRRLVDEHRAPMYPLVLVDGEFFSCGRLPKAKLRRRLQQQAAAA